MRDVAHILGYMYIPVGRVADRENCAWASAIFERSGSIAVRKKATLTISEDSTILIGIAELRLIDQRHQTGLKSTLAARLAQRHFTNICHVTLDPRPSLVFSCK